MRFAFFSPHSDPLAELGQPDSGGQCIYEAEVMTALAEKGHEVRCYTRAYGTRPHRERVANDAWVLRYPAGPDGFVRKEDLGPYLAEFAHRVIDDEQHWLETADMFHGHYWDGGVTALEVSLAFGKPIVFTSHSLGAFKRRSVPDPSADGSTYKYHVRVPAEQRILRAVDGVIALSESEKQELLGPSYRADESKIHVVPGGVDVDAFAPKAGKVELKTRLGIESDFMVFTTGRIDRRKGFKELISAIPIVIQALHGVGKTVTFVLPAGPKKLSNEEADYKNEMLAEVELLDIGRYIHWFERLSNDDLKIHYEAADVFVCASAYEPFGLVLVEAFASGTPVVATCHGGPTQIVTPGKDGYLAEPRDSQELGARIADLLLQKDEDRKQMGQAAMTKARSVYAWPAVATGLVKAYESILGACRI